MQDFFGGRWTTPLARAAPAAYTEQFGVPPDGDAVDGGGDRRAPPACGAHVPTGGEATPGSDVFLADADLAAALFEKGDGPRATLNALDLPGAGRLRRLHQQVNWPIAFYCSHHSDDDCASPPLACPGGTVESRSD